MGKGLLSLLAHSISSLFYYFFECLLVLCSFQEVSTPMYSSKSNCRSLWLSSSKLLIILLMPFISLLAQEETLVANKTVPSQLGSFKYAYVKLTPTEDNVSTKPSLKQLILDSFNGYMSKRGILTSATTPNLQQMLLDQAESYCDILWAELFITIKGDKIKDHSIVYTSCTREQVVLHTNEEILIDGNMTANLKRVWTEMFNGNLNYDPTKRPKLLVIPTGWSAETLSQHFSTATQLDALEGVYESPLERSDVDPELSPRKKIGIIKSTAANNGKGAYMLVYLSDSKGNKDWVEGEEKGYLLPTKTPDIYRVFWRTAQKQLDDSAYMTIDQNGSIIIAFNRDPNKSIRFDRIHPIMSKQLPKPELEMVPLATGSGALLTPNGYLITNNHVVTGGKKFVITMEHKGLGLHYYADLVHVDVDNDIALLKISDPGFKNRSTLPYTFKTELADVGESLFTLGYPLTSTMGSEMKLARGVVAAHSGFRGDKTTYQTDIPVDPGNSGGAVFDNMGNWIGIIKSKHSEAEQASYVIKNHLIYDMVQQVDSSIRLPFNDSLKGRKATSQIKILREYVCFIRVY